MAQKRKSYLQIAREAKSLSREVVAEETGLDVSTLYRYEQNPANVPTDAMNMLIDAIGDKYIGYLSLMDNHVARRFIPGGVRRMTIQEAILSMAVIGKSLYEEIQEMMEIAMDGVINEDEIDKWLKSKKHIKEFIATYIGLECADGTDK